MTTFEMLLDEIGNLHNRKRKDYASSNEYSNFGEAASWADTTTDETFMTLVGVKLARLRNLLSRSLAPENESIEDTKTDLAVYLLIWVAYNRDKNASLRSR